MLFQQEIMVKFSIDMHTNGQNSATSTTCNFERSMVPTSFFLHLQSKPDQNYPKTNLGDNLTELIFCDTFVYKIAILTPTSLSEDPDKQSNNQFLATA